MNLEEHSNVFYDILSLLRLTGQLVSPRDQLVLEVENFSYILPPYVRFMNFESRKFSLDYVKREFVWYLKGERFDNSICQYAKIWKQVMNKDGSINSNYGQYLFKNKQFHNVINILQNDKDSRRATMTILNSEHLLSDTNDVPCTYALNFRIRNDYLNMTVHMRSQDAIFGMGNDAPTFSFIHEMMLNSLKRFYPQLQYGNYYHFVDSFHVYERHFNMLDKILEGDKFELIDCPKISDHEEVEFLLNHEFSKIPERYEFSKWLNALEDDNS